MVNISEAIDAAFCSAVRVTLVGSITPALYNRGREMPEPTKLDSNSREFQIPQPQRGCTDPIDLVRLLDEWMRDDEAEQRATFQSLRQALDEDRPAGYKLFS